MRPGSAMIPPSTRSVPPSAERRLGVPIVDISERDDEIAIIETDESDDDSDEMADFDDEMGESSSKNHHPSGSSNRRTTMTSSRTRNKSSNNSTSRFRRTSSKPNSGGGGLWTPPAAVDQSINLMTGTTTSDLLEDVDVSGRPLQKMSTQTTSRPSRLERLRGSMGRSFRQKSMVDIFLTSDDINHGYNSGAASSSRSMRTVGMDYSRNPEYGIHDRNQSVSFWRTRKCRLCVCAVLLLAVIVSAVVVVTVVPMKSGNNESDADDGEGELEIEESVEVSRPGADNSNTPNEDDVNVDSIPKTTRLEALFFVLTDQQITAQSDLDLGDSPQQKALVWLAQTDPAKMEIPGMDNIAKDVSVQSAVHALLQRYALAVFYFSMQAAGDGTNDDQDNRRHRGLLRQLQTTTHQIDINNRAKFDEDWLSAKHMCEWTGIVCDDAFEYITFVRLPDHLLQGSIPSELLNVGSMPRLKRLDFRNNQLRGTIPSVGLLDEKTESELGLSRPTVSALTELDLHNNRITGTLDNVMDMTLLETLDVAKNRMTGSLPAEIENLTDLGAFCCSCSLKNWWSLRFMFADTVAFFAGTAHINDTGANFFWFDFKTDTLKLYINKFSGSLPANSFEKLTNLGTFSPHQLGDGSK